MAHDPPAPPCLTVRVHAGETHVTLTGCWLRTQPLPAWPENLGAVVIHLDAQSVTDFDTVLPAWIQGWERSLTQPSRLTITGLNARATAWLELRSEETVDSNAVDRLPFLEQLGQWASLSNRSWGRALAHLGECALGTGRLLLGRGKANWSEFPQLLRTAGPDALPIVLLLGFLTGVIMAYVALIQLGKVGADAYVANLVGLAMTREMGALMTGIIACGRTATAYASHLGSMNVSQETDALRALGLRPVEYLALPRILAVMIVLPLLTVFASAAGILGGMTVAVGAGLAVEQYMTQVIEAVSISSFLSGIIKAYAFAVVAAWAGCYRGAVARPTARGVGEAATTSAVLGITLIVIADAIFAVLFNLFEI